MSAQRLLPFLHLCAVLSCTAAVGMICGLRLHDRGQWFPSAPTQIGYWIGMVTPLDLEEVKELGDPKTLGGEFQSPLGEIVSMQVIGAQSTEAFREPVISRQRSGYDLTAERFSDVFGPGKRARASVFKQASGARTLMLCWVQYQDGSTSPGQDLRGYSDTTQRVIDGWNTVRTGKQCVMVRVYTTVGPDDPDGAQGRRNLYSIARGMYEGIKEDGAHWRGSSDTQGAHDAS